MKKRFLVTTLVVGALLTGTLVLAGPGGYGKGNCGGKGPGEMSFEQHEERMGNKLEMMGAVLDLTSEQKAQLETLFNQQYLDHQDLRDQMHASREAMHEAKNAKTFNEADFRAKASKQAELKTEMMVAHVKLKQQVYALLTPEQQEKADTLGGLMGSRGKGGHHGGMGF